MNIVITGSNGMLANAFKIVLNNNKNYSVNFEDRNSLDITDKDQIDSYFQNNKIDILINCAAYTKVDQAESGIELANQINGSAVGYLAQLCKESNIIFITYSTDYVFDGENQNGYKEEDITNPINAYGKSKELGEQITKQIGGNYYIFRIQWTYGPNGKNFVKTICTAFKEGKNLKIVNNEFGSPTYTLDIAKKTIDILENKKDYPYGIYHITNSEVTNWHEFAEFFLSLYSKHNVQVEHQRSEDIIRQAKRPHFSKLISTKNVTLRDWQTAVNDFIENRDFE